MYLGRFILGEEVPLTALAEAGGGERLQPATPASWTVYDADGDRVAGGLMPARDRGRVTGLFRHDLQLGSAYAAGRYLVRVSWADGSYCRQEASCFDVVAGGHADGQVVSQRFLSRPGGDAVVRKTDGGKRYIGRRPTP